MSGCRFIPSLSGVALRVEVHKWGTRQNKIQRVSLNNRDNGWYTVDPGSVNLMNDPGNSPPKLIWIPSKNRKVTASVGGRALLAILQSNTKGSFIKSLFFWPKMGLSSETLTT